MLAGCWSGSAPTTVDHRREPKRATPTAHVLQFQVVDSDASWSKALFAHVGPDAHGVPHDPKAVAAGIEGNIDSWEDQAGTRHIEYYLQGDRTAIERYIADAGAQDHELSIPSDRELAFEQLDGKVRTHLLVRPAAVDERAIRWAKSVLAENTSRPVVLLVFSDDGKEAFARLTQRVAGQKLAIRVHGRITSVFVIKAPILEGRTAIPMAGTDVDVMKKEADELASALAKRPPAH